MGKSIAWWSNIYYTIVKLKWYLDSDADLFLDIKAWQDKPFNDNFERYVISNRDRKVKGNFSDENHCFCLGCPWV
jgi:hypothetical protein